MEISSASKEDIIATEQQQKQQQQKQKPKQKQAALLPPAPPPPLSDPLGLTPALTLTDIGVNLLDDMFLGKYFGKDVHEADITVVLERAKRMGVGAMVLTAGTINDSRAAIAFVRKVRSDATCGGSGALSLDLPKISCTVGIHPTHCSVFKDCSPEGAAAIISELEELINDGLSDGSVVAIGECGLDYDRLEFCDKDSQRIGFLAQIAMASKFDLPLFLHDRNTGNDFTQIISDNISVISRIGGVAHSFTDSMAHMQDLVKLGLFIGINGCSLKTEDNLEVAKSVPLERLLIETDAPYCGIKKSSAAFKYILKTHFPQKDKKKYDKGLLVDGRCEPCLLVQVLEVLAGLRSMDPAELAEMVTANTAKWLMGNRKFERTACFAGSEETVISGGGSSKGEGGEVGEEGGCAAGGSRSDCDSDKLENSGI